MKLIYISPSQLPSKAAHSVHVMKMCEAFAKEGHSILLINPVKTKQAITDQKLFNFYNVQPLFTIRHFKYLSFRGNKIINPVRVAIWLLFQDADITISRDINVAIYAAAFGKKVIYDAHHIFVKKGYNQKLLQHFFKSRNLLKFTVVANKMKAVFMQMGVPAAKIEVIRNGTSAVTTKEIIPAITGNDRFNIGYIGHLYAGKGMEVIEAIAPLLSGTVIHIVGGLETDIEYWKNKIFSDNVIFHGFISQQYLSAYINSFDACLLPNQQHVIGVGKKKNIGDITCPLKMFDYMAHRKAIAASDLAVLREVLNEDTAIFCGADKPTDWVKAITELQNNKVLRDTIADNAYELFIHQYTWQKRAQRLLDDIKI